MPDNIVLQPGLFAYQGRVTETRQHKHLAIQLVLPNKACRLHVAEQLLEGPCLLASNCQHSLQMESGWLVLIEPQSVLGELCNLLLADKSCCALTSKPAVINVESIVADLYAYLAESSQQISISLPSKAHYAVTDARIVKLLNQLDGCFVQECLKPERWRANEVAHSLALSEGRFLHLFKGQMGIAWRPYLLWRRLLCAVQLLTHGNSATQAAYQAGFADSAHLSRTFKQNFGLTIRDASNLKK